MTDDPARKGLNAVEREELEHVFDRMMRGEGPQELSGSLGEKVRAMLQKLKELHPQPPEHVELSPEVEAWLDAYIDAQEKKLH